MDNNEALIKLLTHSLVGVMNVVLNEHDTKLNSDDLESLIKIINKLKGEDK